MSDIGTDIQTVAGIQLAMMQATNPRARGQHFKMHGCVDALFEVADGLPDGLRVGLSPLSTSFAELRTGLEAVREELVARR